MSSDEIRELILDASNWVSRDDVYDSFFTAVGAPEWHGRNFNALRDSIAVGSIDEVEVPYRLVITNYRKVGEGAREIAADFVDLISELETSGVRVAVRVEP